ncbi:hypothetical protein ACOMHN_006380 [Nucella lapillus]
MPHVNISPRPHKRAVSLKKPRKKTFEIDELDEMRPRTSSLPTKNSIRRPILQYLTPPHTSSSARDHDEFYTIRSFVTTSKGQLVNRGDSLRSRSTNSIMSSGSGSMTELTRLSQASSQCSLCHEGSGPESPSALPLLYRVLMLGSAGVGKSSLTQQFATSEYLGTFGPSIEGRTEEAECLMIEAEGRTEEAECLMIEAEGRTEEAECLMIEAEGRTEEAECLMIEAESRTEEAECLMIEAEGRTEEAECLMIAISFLSSCFFLCLVPVHII